MKRPILIAQIALAALTSACHRTKPVAPAPIPPPTNAPAIVEQPSNDAERVRAERERAESERARARATLSAPVYFAYDASELDDRAMSSLDQKRAVLANSPNVRIRIAGHTDDRGSDEYNLALGQRRAAAARNYLVQQGIDSSRIEIESYGEEQPACEGIGENCWAKNRRAEVSVISGAISTGGQ